MIDNIELPEDWFKINLNSILPFFKQTARWGERDVHKYQARIVLIRPCIQPGSIGHPYGKVNR